jgi:ubiquinone/menaquinone biosynthesis C-methylase UbiE
MTLTSSRQVSREFDRLASAYARRHTQKSAREACQFTDWIGLRPHEFVLDAACGPGALARTIARGGARVFALDISPRMLELARRHGCCRRLAGLIIGNVESLPYATGTFDLVTCTYAFANFRKSLGTLREFARVTRADGRIAIIDVVAPENPRRRSWLNQVEARRSHLDTHILSRSQFLKLFEAAGLVLRRSASHCRRQRIHEWLELSPALTKQSTARIRGLFRKSQRIKPAPQQRGRDEQYVSYATEWFLLHKRIRRNRLVRPRALGRVRHSREQTEGP